jgi:hypothetical protein
VKSLLPVPDLLAGFQHGIKFGEVIRATVCGTLSVPDNLYFEVPITGAGLPLANGFTFGSDVDPRELSRLVSLGVPRPDFVFGAKPPRVAGGYSKTWLIAEAKATTATLYSDYIRPGRKAGQFWAITHYAQKHVSSRTALFITGVKGENVPHDSIVIGEIGKSTLGKGVLPIVIRLAD